MKQYRLVIEEFACWGCRTCELACQQEFNPVELPDGIKYLSVWADGPKLVNGKLEFLYRVRVCKHCEDPPCMEGCPEEAISKRGDGIVILDQTKCSGCRLCLDRCPFGAIQFDEEKRTAAKCNLCHHRVDRGLYPACADNVCLAHCIYFGDPSEIERQIQEKRRRRKGS